MKKTAKKEIILPSKKAKKNKKTVKLDNMGFFQRLRYKHKLRVDKRARQRAESLASLPKNPIKRFFAHFQPKRVFKYWFSWYGLSKILKFFAACFLLGIIFVGGLFLYFKNEIKDIQLSNLTISETVNT